MEKGNKYKNIEIKELDNSEIEIKIEFEGEILPSYWTNSLKKITKNLEIPGFRKGQVPEKMAIEKISENTIWEDAIEDLLKDVYPEIVAEKKIKAIGRPEIVILKSVPKAELEVKIKTAVFPEIKIADYKKIAGKVQKIKESDSEISEEELEKVIELIKNERKSEDGKTPEFNDEFVKSLGGFENVKDFKEKIGENMKQDKANRKKGEKRMEIIEEIIKESDINLPLILIEGELDKMIFEFKGEIESAGLNFNDYLEKSKTTEEKLRLDWKPRAEKKAKTQIVLNEIAEKEDIKPDENKVIQEIETVLENYPEANEERARIFIETVMTNESVFDFLEKLSEKE